MVKAAMIRTEVEAASRSTRLATSVPDDMAAGPMVVPERRRPARMGAFHLRSLALAVQVALGIVKGLGLTPTAGGAVARAASSGETVQQTPVLMRVDHVPIPVEGSDGCYHVVYELALTNFAKERVTVGELDVLDADDGQIVASLDAEALAERLVVNDTVALPGSLGAAQAGLVYMHVIFETRDAVPHTLEHRLSGVVGEQPFSETAGSTRLAPPTDLVFDAPLRGVRYIAGDGCCDAPHHVRATLPLNGQLFTAQRFAIDWEQLDDQGRIYVGDRTNPASYIIYYAKP